MSNSDAILLNRALAVIAKKLDEQRNTMTDGACKVPNDPAATGANYLYQAGVIFGLRLADREIREALQKISKGEGDE